MKDRERNRPTRISLAACERCRLTVEPVIGGQSCPRCGGRTVTALVILPRKDATVAHAAELLLDTLARMAASAPTL